MSAAYSARVRVVPVAEWEAGIRPVCAVYSDSEEGAGEAWKAQNAREKLHAMQKAEQMQSKRYFMSFHPS